MPVIKIKHVVSFSSEDKVHKAENILKAEAYRKWKCATPGEKKASIVLQFEKATQIHSIDIGNECSAFVEVLVGRSSDSVNDFQVLLVASSFMSPLESRNETHPNRVRMFGSDKLSQNIKDEKWDCVQIVCTQPFNKNISYGLSFIKFHSPPENDAEPTPEKEVKKAPTRLGAFQIKYDDDDDDNSNDKSTPSIGSWLERKNKKTEDNSKISKSPAPSYADAVLTSSQSPPLYSPGNALKRKVDSNDAFDTPPAKKDTSVYHVNKKKIGYKDILDKNVSEASTSSVNTDEDKNKVKDIFGLKKNNASKVSAQKANGGPNATVLGKVNKKPPFQQIMKKVIFVISGFVNPLRSEIRDKALEMGAKYKGDWDRSCTHLVCAFENTPKYIQVKRDKGIIVSKDWIIDCHKKKTLLPWRKYMLGKYSRDSSEESSSESDEESPPPKKTLKDNPKLNGTKTREVVKNTSNPVPSTSNSEDRKKKVSVDDSESNHETDDDAVQDYMADTDVGSNPNDSGGDTEDEIMKVEKQAAEKALKKEENEDSVSEDDDSSLLSSKPDTSDLPLPNLPNLFKKRHFYLYGDFSKDKLFDIERYITAYDGILDQYMSDSTKYVVTDSQWDKSFDDALSEHEDIVFVKSKWIFKCHEAQKLVPYQSFVVIPAS